MRVHALRRSSIFCPFQFAQPALSLPLSEIYAHARMHTRTHAHIDPEAVH